jgi:hypothetical protein
MALFAFFRRRRTELPCEVSGDCPYEYDKHPERDIEGMPFIDDDPRSCPTYGHICPEFMEELGLTVEELKIRAIIHCGLIAKGEIERGDRETTEAFEKLLEELDETMRRYPPDRYPRYY